MPPNRFLKALALTVTTLVLAFFLIIHLSETLNHARLISCSSPRLQPGVHGICFLPFDAPDGAAVEFGSEGAMNMMWRSETAKKREQYPPAAAAMNILLRDLAAAGLWVKKSVDAL